MITESDYTLFDPQNMDSSLIPDEPGNLIVVLRGTSSLPTQGKISATPTLTPFEYKGEKYDVIFVGKSKNLRTRIYRQHFEGTGEISTLRKSLGCLLGFDLIPLNANSRYNDKTTFEDEDEYELTKWMKDNLLLFYFVNDDYSNVGKELMRTYNPPLNLQGNFYKTNLEYRQELSVIRSGNSKVKEKSANKQPTKTSENKPIKKKSTWPSTLVKALISVVIVVSVYRCYANYYEEHGDEDRIGKTENTVGVPAYKVELGVKRYLKQYYLKDPDSYEGISWGACGVYNSSTNTYFATHRYRAKNSYGGYVVEEKVFVLDSEGNVIKILENIYDAVDGY